MLVARERFSSYAPPGRNGETQHKSMSLNWKMMLLHMVLKLIGTLEMVHFGPHSTLYCLEGKEMSL